MTKICYITDLLSPYRIEWMNLLSSDFKICAYYFDESEKSREAKWFKSAEPKFEIKKVKNIRFAGIRFSRSLFKILKKPQYDIYLIDGYASLVQVHAIHWLTKRKKRVFVNVDGIDIWLKRSFIGRIKDIVKTGIYRSGANFLCGSETAYNTIIKSGAKTENVFRHPFTTIYQSDIISFEDKIHLQDEYKKKINAQGKKVALAVGRFVALKRYEDLIKAWQSIGSDCVLYLIGNGILKEKYEKMIYELSVKNIIVLDHMSKENLNDYYIAADLFVHTSATETWGLVFNEAMAKGCPVITTDRCVGGVELVENSKNGYIVEVGNVEQSKDRIYGILYNDNLRTEMMANSIKKIKPYTYENMIKAQINAFRGLSDNDNNKC